LPTGVVDMLTTTASQVDAVRVAPAGQDPDSGCLLSPPVCSASPGRFSCKQADAGRHKIHSKSGFVITGKWRGDDHQLPLGEQQNVHPAPEAFRDVKAPGTGHLPPGRRGVA